MERNKVTRGDGSIFNIENSKLDINDSIFNDNEAGF